MIHKKWCVLLGAIVAGTAAATERPRPHPQLLPLYYDFEVASYCGLTTDRVGDGFRRATVQVISQHEIDDAQLESTRMEAWKLAHLEWQNRGLGGFRGWCRNEGKQAAERFLSVPQ
jgi:hypothetical protein